MRSLKCVDFADECRHCDQQSGCTMLYASIAAIVATGFAEFCLYSRWYILTLRHTIVRWCKHIFPKAWSRNDFVVIHWEDENHKRKKKYIKQRTNYYSTVFCLLLDSVIIFGRAHYISYIVAHNDYSYAPFWITFLQTARRSNWFGGGGVHSM